MKIIKYIILIGLFIFTFYVSDRLIIYVEGLSPIMKSINEYDFKDTLPVDAIIDGNNIIPGKSGLSINKRESYLKMNDFGKFNETFLVYDKQKPNISLQDNMDKIIIKGNKDNSVSLIINNDEHYKYLMNNNINFTTIISDVDNVLNNDNVNYLNALKDKYSFSSYSSKLRRKRISFKGCLVGVSDLELCKKNKYYLIKESISISNINLSDILNVTSGDIILIDSKLNITNLKFILSNLKYNNFNIIKLSDLIDE